MLEWCEAGMPILPYIINDCASFEHEWTEETAMGVQTKLGSGSVMWHGFSMANQCRVDVLSLLSFLVKILCFTERSAKVCIDC